MIFLIEWQWIWFKNYVDPENHPVGRYINENPQNFVTFKIVFSINGQSSMLSNKEKTYTLFVYRYNIFSVIDPNEILTLYNDRTQFQQHMYVYGWFSPS